MASRVPVAAIEQLTTDLFSAVGLAPERARIVARGFLEADLLGFSTHGLSRVPANLRWLETGRTRMDGAPGILVDKAAYANWNADFLPGPLVMHDAIEHALAKLPAAGVFTMTLRRAQHVACLASYLIPVVERGFVGLLIASTPDESFVSPFAGREPLFSNNPLAFCAPSSSLPVLFDISMAITAGGQIDRAARQGQRMPEALLKDHHGRATDDPRVMTSQPPGSVMPMGGLGHGHKGHALTIMTEVLTQALGGYGRAVNPGDGEANSVFLQLIDPAVFGPRADYLREIDYLLQRIVASEPDNPEVPVRVPGERAWRRRAQQLEAGAELYPGVLDALRDEAQRLSVSYPESLPGTLTSP